MDENEINGKIAIKQKEISVASDPEKKKLIVMSDFFLQIM